MKRIFFLLVTMALCAPAALRAQDAATEERMNKLSGRIEDISAAQEVLRKQITGLMKDVDSLREQAAKPSPNYASPDQLNRLADAIKEVDRKRIEDAETTRSELLKLRKLLEAPISSSKSKPVSKPPKETTSTPGQPTSDRNFEYVIRSGDTLDAIVMAYREKNIKVTVKQIVNNNPGLVPERLQVGQKIYIPVPQ